MADDQTITTLQGILRGLKESGAAISAAAERFAAIERRLDALDGGESPDEVGWTL